MHLPDIDVNYDFNDCISVVDIRENDVRMVIDHLNVKFSPGSDNVHPLSVKFCANVSVPLLPELYNIHNG